MKGASIVVVVESGGAGVIGDSEAGAFETRPILEKPLVYTCHEAQQSSRGPPIMTELEVDGVYVHTRGYRDLYQYQSCQRWKVETHHLFLRLQICENIYEQSGPIMGCIQHHSLRRIPSR